jgi:hypothetical protein
LPLGPCGERRVCQQEKIGAIQLLAESNLYTSSQYEKMFGNAGFVKTTQLAASDSLQQQLVS